MDNIILEKIANLICEDCPHQGDNSFPCEKKLPCIYAQGLAEQIYLIESRQCTEDEVKRVDWEYYNIHNHHWEVDKLLQAQAEIFKKEWGVK